MTKYFMMKNLEIVGTDLETQRPKKLSPRAFNKRNYWDRFGNLMARPNC